MMPRTALAPLLILAATIAAPLHAQSRAVDEAAAAYGVYDVNRAETLYREAAASAETPARERGIAWRELARIAWLVEGDAARARSLLARSIPQDPDPCPAAFLYARILNDGRDRAAPAPWLEDMATRCRAVEPGVAIERVRALVLQAAAIPAGFRADALRRATSAWSALPGEIRTSPAAARLLLSLGMLARDPARAFEGWRGYLGVQDGESLPQALIGEGMDGAQLFRDGLAPSASPSARLDLASMLMRAGFHEDLRRFIADTGLDREAAEDSRFRTLNAYLNLLDGLHAAIAAHDRHFARHGGGDEEAYEARLRGLLREAVGDVGDGGDDPWPALRRTFNLYGAIGKTNGVSSLHLGHVVVDERQRVTQGARSGSLRFIAIDNMIHNGFSGWLADGAGGPGGWAVNGTTIIQVRPRYLAVVETALALARPGEARDRMLADIESKRRNDRTVAQANPISFLPGVRERLRLQGIDDIAAQVRTAGTAEADFAPAFRRAFSAAVFGSSIIAHEGRHALDQLEFTGAQALANEELEYRAKLSEIALAASPRLALSSIYSPLFGGTSGHGIANRRLAEALARWIEGHSAEIDGYDPLLTPLEQLDRLSNAQLRAIVSGLDPAASGSAREATGQ